jgi:hypothetical protein
MLGDQLEMELDDDKRLDIPLDSCPDTACFMSRSEVKDSDLVDEVEPEDASIDFYSEGSVGLIWEQTIWKLMKLNCSQPQWITASSF